MDTTYLKLANVLQVPVQSFFDEAKIVVEFSPEMAEELRKEGYSVSTVLKAKKVGKQLGALERDGFKGAAFFGEEGVKIFGENNN